MPNIYDFKPWYELTVAKSENEAPKMNIYNKKSPCYSLDFRQGCENNFDTGRTEYLKKQNSQTK